MKNLKKYLVFSVIFVFINFSTEAQQQSTLSNKKVQTAYFASGCFWCVEAIYENIKGVRQVFSGYAGGHTKNPTYKAITTGITGHTETVAVYYDQSKVSFKNLVVAFFASHNPTTLNGQYPDFGTQYRSVAFYSNTFEKEIIEKMIAKLNKEKYNGEIVTEVKKMDVFYKAEEYHQNFERRNPNNGYLKAVSIPRLERFKKVCPLLIRK